MMINCKTSRFGTGIAHSSWFAVFCASGLPAVHELRECGSSYPYDLKVFGRVSAKAASWDTVFTDTYKHIRDMERIAKQVLNVRGRKGCAAALSREYQRNWSDRAWQVAIAKGNYDLGRQHLNFQISKGRQDSTYQQEQVHPTVDG